MSVTGGAVTVTLEAVRFFRRREPERYYIREMLVQVSSIVAIKGHPTVGFYSSTSVGYCLIECVLKCFFF